MTQEKRRKLEKELRSLETDDATKERLKYFYSHNKEYYEKENKKLSYKIGAVMATIEEYNKELTRDISEMCRNSSVLSKLTYSEDIEKYLSCLDEMVKPLEPIPFDNTMINDEMVLGYLSKKIPLQVQLAVAAALSHD